MVENANNPAIEPQQHNPPSRVDIQLLLWSNCKYLSELIDDFKTDKKKPSKKWTNLVYFMQGQNALAKTLLDSIKDSEIDDLTRQILEIKAVLEKKGLTQA